MVVSVKNNWDVFLFLILIFSCSQEKPISKQVSISQNKIFEVNESLVSVMGKDDSLLVNSLLNYTKDLNNINYNHMDSWFYSDSSSVYPYFELYKNVIESNKIQVLALINQKGYKVLKLAFLNESNIETILKIPAIPSKEMGYILLNYYDTFNRVSPEQFDNIRYFNHSNHQIIQDEVKEMRAFGKELSMFFDVPEINFDYFMFDNSEELFSALGYYYSPNMFDAYQSNSFCRPADLSIFSGNSSAYHPHELTHLYIHSFVGNGNPNNSSPNRFLDEGFATYFGGAQGFSLEESTQLALDNFQTREECFENIEQLGFLIEDVINFKNVFFGNFVKYLIDFYSPEYALNMLKTYKTEDELDLLIASHMLLDETFNEFVFRIILSNSY